jgi:hypothetical protein
LPGLGYTSARNAAREASAAAEHIRRSAHRDPATAADAAWAAADILHAAARALNSQDLRRAADSYDRAARACHGRIPRASRPGHQLRATARLLAMTGQATGSATLVAVALIPSLITLAAAVAELRLAQQHAAQAAAARDAATRLHAACAQDRSRRSSRTWPAGPRARQATIAAATDQRHAPVPPRPQQPVSTSVNRTGSDPRRGTLSPRRARARR